MNRRAEPLWCPLYDTLGNLVRVTLPNSDVITYTVDGRGRRVAKGLNGTRVKAWLYADQLRPIAELDGNGDLVSRFVYGTKPNVPEYIVKNGTTYRVFSDHLGSPRVIVDATTGTVVQRMDFHAFGEVVQDSNPGWQPFGFAGGLYDPATGLIRFGVRDYDAGTGRWTAKDPIGHRGGDAALYSYASVDPANLIDPSGLTWIDSTLATSANLFAGFGDTLTSGFGLAGFFGLPSLTEALRGGGPAINKCSTAYGAGRIGGYAWGVAAAWSLGLSGGANSVFWAGHGANIEAAALGTTIGQTPIGALMTAFGVESRLAWGAASATFAANASDKAIAVVRHLDQQSLWRLEKAILDLRNIPILYK